MRPTQVLVDLMAITENVLKLSKLVPDTKLCCVVKADGYGHGAVPAANAALDAGVDWLAVALVEEGIELRQNDIDSPILLLTEPRPDEMVEVVEHDLRPTIYTSTGLSAAGGAMELNPNKDALPVHLKVNTGMHRVGVDIEEGLSMAKALMDRPNLHLEGVLTHLAVADEPENPYNQTQLDRFEDTLQALAAEGIEPEYRHAANSAGFLYLPNSRYNMARVGISIYGIPPIPDSQNNLELEPALALTSEVAHMRKVKKGESVSYGLRYQLSEDANIAVIPIGYADGIRRDYDQRGGEVLLNGKRCPVVGVVTMDQLMVLCSDEVSVGDVVVLIGKQGDEEITVQEIADKLGTIPYEVVCSISERVRRDYE